LFDFTFLKALPKPKAFIHADRDEFGSLEKVQAFVATLPEPKRLFVVPDSDHLATGRLDAFSAVAKEAVAWLMP